MPEEWERKGWAAPNGGWPTFDGKGKIVRPEPETEEEETEDG